MITIITSVPSFGSCLPKEQAKKCNPLALAFLGDAVYEVLVREKVVLDPSLSVRKHHSASVAKVRASYQAKRVSAIESLLSEEESDILRRGRNAHTHIPKSATVSEYRLATGLEALFGYLSLIGDRERILELFAIIYTGE
ncbi:MAG: ribonuclease III [Oscillospiraceae bacterium]|nr:ribonuclease III [Oscillospiraceae bacterium]